jgi:chorismate mutase
MTHTVARLCVLASAVTAAMALGATAQAMTTPGNPARPARPAANNTEPLPALGPLGPLTDLAIQRVRLSDQVAAAKFGTGLPIDDPAREQAELAQVRQQAAAMGIDPDATVLFFQHQIDASKIVQRGLFALWTAHPELAPTTRPSLTTIRQELDQITAEMLSQLRTVQHLMADTPTCHRELAEARISGEILNHLTALHRHALATALASVCTGHQNR